MIKKAPDIANFLKRHRHLLTIQNVGLAVAIVVAIVWIWGAVVTLQKNYAYQRQVDANDQLIELKKLQNKTYKYQQTYYKSDEYLELSARARLNKALPGEHLVVLPSSEGIKDAVLASSGDSKMNEESNFSRWMRFFFDKKR